MGSPSDQLYVEPDIAAQRSVRSCCDLCQLTLDELVEIRLTGGGEHDLVVVAGHAVEAEDQTDAIAGTAVRIEHARAQVVVGRGAEKPHVHDVALGYRAIVQHAALRVPGAAMCAPGTVICERLGHQ